MDFNETELKKLIRAVIDEINNIDLTITGNDVNKAQFETLLQKLYTLQGKSSVIKQIQKMMNIYNIERGEI